MTHIASGIVDVFPFRLRDGKVEFLVLQMNPKVKPIPLDKPIWQVVHGGIEPGEIAPEAALREFGEETGLEPLAVYQLDDIHVQRIRKVRYPRYPRNDLPIHQKSKEDWIDLTVVFAIQCDEQAQPTLSPEHVDFKWLERKDAERHLRFAAHRRALREIESGFQEYDFDNLWRIR